MTSPRSSPAGPPVPGSVLQESDFFICPACAAPLQTRGDRAAMECTGCRRGFLLDNGLPLLFWPTEWTSKVDVTELVKSFCAVGSWGGRRPSREAMSRERRPRVG
jgi:uncharacterized protein YbaR (Trm112 family)